MSRLQVTLQVRSSGVDAYGQLNNTWDDVKVLGANVSNNSLTESISINREVHTSVLQFDFNRSPTSIGITPDHRLQYGSKFYYVISSDTLSTRHIVSVVAEERA